MSFAETPLEDWLQQLLDEAPEVLPISDIDERIETPLLSLGREVATDAGPIDNLFISKNGYVVVVETKLFRNPEARRQVVAQILDYAVHVRTWRYSRLNELSAKQRTEKSLYAAINPEGMTESQWIDRVNENLEAGRMALLVVGDGIRTETEALAEAVAGHPDFQFRLALVELRVFSLDDNRKLVVPATLVKTQEIERAIVTVLREGSATSGASATVVVSTPPSTSNAKKRSPLSEEAFLAVRRGYEDGERYVRVIRALFDQLKPPLQIVWTASSFTVKLPDPAGSGTMLSLLAVPLEGDAYAYTPWLRDQLQRLWGDEVATKAICDAELKMLNGFGAKLGKSDDASFDLLLLERKEEDFANGLREIAGMIETSSSRLAGRT